MHVPRLSSALALSIAVGLSSIACAAPFKWVDEKGRVVYGDRPPDDTARQLGGAGFVSREPGDPSVLPQALRETVRRAPVVLYTGRNCDPCQTARDHLNARGIPFSERTLSTEADVTAFRSLGFETMAVPSLRIAGNRLTGFEPGTWRQALDDAGYPARSSLPAAWRAPDPAPLAQRGADASPTTTSGQVVERVTRDTSSSYSVLEARPLITGRGAIRF
jgi:glutaredoxin